MSKNLGIGYITLFAPWKVHKTRDFCKKYRCPGSVWMERDGAKRTTPRNCLHCVHSAPRSTWRRETAGKQQEAPSSVLRAGTHHGGRRGSHLGPDVTRRRPGPPSTSRGPRRNWRRRASPRTLQSLFTVVTPHIEKAGSPSARPQRAPGGPEPGNQPLPAQLSPPPAGSFHFLTAKSPRGAPPLPPPPPPPPLRPPGRDSSPFAEAPPCSRIPPSYWFPASGSSAPPV